MPGLDKNRLKDSRQMDDEILCAICLMIFIDPLVTPCCRQTYCRECISEWIIKNNTCPNDRRQLTTKELVDPPQFLLSMLNKLEIVCQFGCKEKVTLETESKHNETCKHNPNAICSKCHENDDECNERLVNIKDCLQKSNIDLDHKINTCEETIGQRNINLLKDSLDSCKMSSIRKFTVFNDICDQIIKKKIALFYIPYLHEIIFTTTDEQVYSFSSFNNKKELKKIKELCFIKLVMFCSNYLSYYCLTETGKIYSWGDNTTGQLGQGSIENISNPTLIKEIVNKEVCGLSCGRYHTLFLTRDGEIFSCGSNRYGQLGNSDEKNQTLPCITNYADIIEDKVSAICCGFRHSIAMTESGFILGWGDNSYNQLGLPISDSYNSPSQIKLPNIKAITCARFSSIFLSKEGEIYFCGKTTDSSLNREMTKIEIMEYFTNIDASLFFHFFLAETENKNYYAYGNTEETNFDGMKSIKCSSLEEAFIDGFGLEITSRTLSFETKNYDYLKLMHLKDSQKQIISEVKSLYSEIKLDNTQNTTSGIFSMENQDDSFTKNDLIKKFSDSFIEIKSVGSGGYGSVFKIMSNIDKRIYAIKKIAYTEDLSKLLEREIAILFKNDLNYNYVVQCYDSWTEQNYYRNKPELNENSSNSSGYNILYEPHRPLLLHILMEYCPLSLEKVIQQINSWTCNGYYIMSELLYEILECVDYLHTKTPAIIHRDIKPSNILLSYGCNGRFIKLTDFGLSTIHEFEDQSHTSRTGSRNYMAPETSTKNYDTKVDVYSLGILIQKMFRFGLNDKQTHQLFGSKFENLKNTTIEMVSYKRSDRPTCKNVIESKGKWILSKKEITQQKSICELLNKSSKAVSITENLEEYFIQNKR